MSESFDRKLLRIPVVRSLIRFVKNIKLPGFEGLSLFDFIKAYTVGIVEGTFSSRASGIAFNFFMAIFPFLLFILNLIPYINIANFQEEFRYFINELMPPQTASFFDPIIVDIAANPRGSLLSFTLLLAIFLMTNGVNAIFSAFEYSYYVTHKRTIVRQYLIALGVSVFLAILLFIAVAVMIFGQYVIVILNDEGVLLDDVVWINILRFIAFFSVIYMVIAVLYYFGTKQGKMSRFFSIGATVTTVFFILTTWLFSVYINNFSSYNELYGSIGALLIMMLYIWINSNLLLLGFELNTTIYQLKSINKETSKKT